MIIYKTINKINGHWYIGKDAGNCPYYYGSGKILINALNKYGKENFEKITLEVCTDKIHLIEREKHWIAISNAVADPNSYNLAGGGEGGDLSKFIDYKNRNKTNINTNGAQQWYKNLTEDQRKEWHDKQGMTRSKGWYVSKIDDATEEYVQNIAKWCEEKGIDKSMPSSLTNPESALFLKQTKGWRIRRADQPELLPYENKRHLPTDNKCKGKTWKIADGKRIWVTK